MGNEAAWADVTPHITDVYGPAIGMRSACPTRTWPFFRPSSNRR